jgi:uncharacterized membrane protein (UPF0127 family)
MKYIIIVLVIASSYLVYRGYTDAISKNVEFGMGNMQIIKKDGSKIDLKVKIADTINERAQGLMDVKEMPEDEGMLFIFEAEEMRKMWMENTYIPLDMLFINAKKEIFNFKENAQPLSRSIIYSVGPAKYVAEFNAGFVKRHNITPGDKIDFQINK